MVAVSFENQEKICRESPRILRDTFVVTERRLAAEFRQPPLALQYWLDPDGGLALPSESVLHGPVADALPAIYSRFKGLKPDIDWRRLAAEALLANLDVDRRLQQVIDTVAQAQPSKWRDALLGLSHYAQPVPAAFYSKLPQTLPAGMQWCFYLMPELIKTVPLQVRDIGTLERRALDFAELHGQKYLALRPDASMPPVLVMPTPSEGGASKWVLVEGLYRCVRAQEMGQQTVQCRDLSWVDLEPYLHQRPFKGWARYHDEP